MIRQVFALAILLLVTSFGICQNSNSLKTDSTTKQLTERLKTFNKLYGYVKYFHPSDEAAELDWDAFAIYGVEQILKSEDKDFKTVLEDLFLPVAPTLQLYYKGENPETKNPDYGKKEEKRLYQIHWQHLGVGNSDISSTYQSRRTYRPIIDNNHENRNVLFLELFKGNVNSFEDFKVKYSVISDSKIFGLSIDTEICFIRGGGSYFPCESIGSTTLEKSQKFTYDFSALTSSNGIAIKLMPRGIGNVKISNIELFKKQNEVWGNPINVINWDHKPAIDNHVTYFSRNDKAPLNMDLERMNSEAIGYLVLASKKDPQFENKLFKSNLKNNENWDANIGSKLFCQLPLVLLGDVNHTYPRSDAEQLKTLQQKLKKSYIHDTNGGDQISYRLANCIITWNIIHHFFPYFDVLDVDWEKIAETAIRRCFADKDKYNHKLTLEWMLAHLEDSHINVRARLDYSKKYYPPFFLSPIKEKFIISAVADTDSSSFHIGDQLVSINDTLFAELVEMQKQYVSAKVERELLSESAIRALASSNRNNKYTFRSPVGISYSVNYSPVEGEFSQYSLKAKVLESRPKYNQIDSTTAYLNFYLINDNEFTELLPKLSKLKNLIIDMRGYPKQHKDTKSILGHFTKKPICNKWLFVQRTEKPDRYKYMQRLNKIGWDIKPILPYIPANIYYLIDHNAISYSESVTGYFDEMDRATMIGSPTAGANGNVNSFNLPGGYTFRFTGMRVLKQNGERLHGIGFVPDVEVIPTAKGLAEGRDEVLEKAIELAKENKDQR